jgi:hypothetical protein
VEKRYELGEVADALRYMGEGHAQGKIVIMPPNGEREVVRVSRRSTPVR